MGVADTRASRSAQSHSTTHRPALSNCRTSNVMPQKIPAIATQEIIRLSRTLELKESKYKSRPTLCIYVLNGSHRESVVWLLSATPVEELIQARPDITDADLSTEFKAAMCGGLHAALFERDMHAPCPQHAGLWLRVHRAPTRRPIYSGSGWASGRAIRASCRCAWSAFCNPARW